MKQIWIALIILLIVIQFLNPEKNLSNERKYDVSTRYTVPENVEQILAAACNDCHSNKTEYPWYADIQPLGWWLGDHIEEGKRELNFSNFTSRPIAVQNHKFEETIEVIKEGEMPLPSYSWLGMHPEGRLTAEQKQLIIDWAKEQMDTLKARYPADSLILKRRKVN